MHIRVVKAAARVIAPEGDGFIPPPCICPLPNCKHCNPDSPPYCPFIIDVPVTDAPQP